MTGIRSGETPPLSGGRRGRAEKVKGITVVVAGFPEFENPEIAEGDAEGTPTSGDTCVALQGEG